MTIRTRKGGLEVATELADFVDDLLLPQLGISTDVFWSGFESIINQLTPRNTELLTFRDDLQVRIDAWHRDRKGEVFDVSVYKQFLKDIGYLLEEGEAFAVGTANVDEEIFMQAGPQLVVPVKNARFALNASNARWGSLYDALYGTDVIPEGGGADRAGGYNPVQR